MGLFQSIFVSGLAQVNGFYLHHLWVIDLDYDLAFTVRHE